jgi:hypothetical protein
MISRDQKERCSRRYFLHESKEFFIGCSIIRVEIIGNISCNHNSIDLFLPHHPLKVIGNWSHDIDVGLDRPPISQDNHPNLPILRSWIWQFDGNPIFLEGSRRYIQSSIPAIGSVAEYFLKGNVVEDGAGLNIGCIIIGEGGSFDSPRRTEDFLESIR